MYEKKKGNFIVEHVGLPHMDDAHELIKEEMTEEEITDAWIYSLSCGDGWQVATDDNGFLTVEKVDAI
jgi:hypothetical protein